MEEKKRKTNSTKKNSSMKNSKTKKTVNKKPAEILQPFKIITSI